QRAQRRRDVGAALGVKSEDDLAPPFGADGSPVDGGAGTQDDGLGETTAPVESAPARGRRRREPADA
ncbi:hypothetical protein ACU5AX_20675, partial [Sphingomonas sp. XXL09]|uniref:hypothetical protein n=1 Tax=Sphingomonas sp. XXL09 TaxID=3457787 RepID=UPI00406BCD41